MTGRSQTQPWWLGGGGVKTTENKIHWPHWLFVSVQPFAYKGSSHQSKGAARHLIHLVWLSLAYPTLQGQNTEISKQIYPEKEYRGLSPNFHIHASVSDLYTPTMGLPFLLEEICRPILGLYKSLTDTWMWKLGLRLRNSQKRNTQMRF